MYEILTQIRVILWMVLHHRWLALAVAALIGMVGWAAVIALPNEYEVRARVYLDTDSVLNPLLRGLAVDNSMQQQAAIVVRRTLLTRPNLMQVMRATDLDLRVDSEIEQEAMLVSLAKNIRVDGHADRRREDANIYTVTYRNREAQLAHDVVDALLDVFLEGVLGSTRMDTSKAQIFLDRQIAQYKGRLVEMEQKLKEFKRAHPAAVQVSGAGYYQRLEENRTALADANLLLREVNRKIGDLDEQLAKVSRTLASDIAAVEDDGSSVKSRVDAMRLRLDQLLLAYTDQHPDVIAARTALTQLQQELEAERAELAANPELAAAGQLRLNPVYQDLSSSRSDAVAAAAAIEARVAEYERRVAALEASMETLPDLEDQYRQLMRDYGVTQETYQSLIQRRESAEISQSADETGEQVQFRVVEPPIVPRIPVWPNRPLFHAGVLLVAVGLGVAAAWLLSQLRPTFYTRNQVISEYGLPVLGTVSMIWSQEQLARRRYGILGYSALAVVFVGLFGTAMAYSLFVQGTW